MPRCKKSLICQSLALALDVFFLRQTGYFSYLSITIRVIYVFISSCTFDGGKFTSVKI